MIELLLGVDFELGSDIYDWAPLVTQGGRASVVATRCQTVRATPAPTPRVPRWDRLLRSLSIRRSAAATRPRARSRSATVYCRGSGWVGFLRGPCAVLLSRMVALSCFSN